ncbi:MAG: radical SAM protein [Candidatus Bathyarchaeota archaeon]|nr:radical SAM protein [Candidatus Bathyarchaeota archaeon]
MKELKRTKSICPECLRVLDAIVFEENNIVYIAKECPEHGSFRDIYWSDYEIYERAKKFDFIGESLENPRTVTRNGCPYDCGICPQHKSHTVLAIIDVTNRCNMRCPVCFATAGTTGYVYEPTINEIRGMLINLRNNRPVPAEALQISGGEPTIREDLTEIIRMAKDLGFKHVEVNTNGLRMASDLDFCRSLEEAGVSTIYLQFDGVSSDVYKFTRGVDLVEVKNKVIENCRKAGIDSIVLVCTLVRGVNDHEVGDIISFAIKNFDVVRCVNFQPVSLCGRIPVEERMSMRITIPDWMKLVEEQTNGQIKASDFYPVPTVVPVSKAVGAIKNRRYVEFTAHPHCGMATYVFIENGRMVPITKYANVDKFIESMKKVYEEASRGHDIRAKMHLIGALRYVRFSMLKKYIWPVLKTGSYKALGDLHRRMLMISAMHFMDPYNFDLERVQRCVIHYAIPDGRIIPFCTMNSIHRPVIEKSMGVSVEEWRAKHRVELSAVT